MTGQGNSNLIRKTMRASLHREGFSCLTTVCPQSNTVLVGTEAENRPLNGHIVEEGSKLNQGAQWEADYKVKPSRKYQDPINKWIKGRIDR